MNAAALKSNIDHIKNNGVIITDNLGFDKKNLSAKILGIIDREWVALKLNELFVIEYYSRKI